MSDIRALRLDDLKWDTATIEIRQSKTGGVLSLPMSERIGEALIDYLKSGRPQTAHREVFLRWRMPTGFEMIGHMKQTLYFGVGQDSRCEAAVSSFRHEMTVRNVRGIALFDHEDGEPAKRVATIAMVCRALVWPLGKPLQGQLTGQFALRQAFLRKKPVKTLQRQGANLILVTRLPFTPILDSHLYHIVDEWRTRAGIEFRTPQRSGLHSLRHYSESWNMPSWRRGPMRPAGGWRFALGIV